MTALYQVYIPTIGWIDASSSDVISHGYTGISAVALLISSFVLILLLTERFDKQHANHREVVLFMLKEVWERITEFEVYLVELRRELAELVQRGEVAGEKVDTLNNLIERGGRMVGKLTLMTEKLVESKGSRKKRAEVMGTFIEVNNLSLQMKSLMNRPR